MADEVMVCPDCKGDGWWVEGDHDDYERVLCWLCEGDGELPRSDYVEKTAYRKEPK